MAVIVNVYVPAVVGVPASVPVPSRLSVNVTPDGSPVCRSTADTANPHVGDPVDVTVKLPARPV